MKKHSRFLFGVLLGFLCAIGVAGYYAYEILYNEILEESAATQVSVEELNVSHPRQLRITVKSINSGQDIRTVTTKSRGRARGGTQVFQRSQLATMQTGTDK